jgi:hypothetical protein
MAIACAIAQAEADELALAQDGCGESAKASRVDLNQGQSCSTPVFVTLGSRLGVFARLMTWQRAGPAPRIGETAA